MKDNTRRIARQIFYTGKSDIEPTEDEEYKLKTKYGIDYPRTGTFNREADRAVKYASEDEESTPSLEDKYPPHTKFAIAGVIDEIEDDFNLDIDNKDPKKYLRLETRLESFRKAVWRKLMFARIPDMYKMDLLKKVEKADDAQEILSLLYYRASS